MTTPAYVSFGWIGEDREIKLLAKNGVWYTAHTIQGQPDPQMVRVHGTNELPTPWPESVGRATVAHELTVRNPHIKIV